MINLIRSVLNRAGQADKRGMDIRRSGNRSFFVAKKGLVKMGKSNKPGWYISWINMILRCYCEVHQSYKYYGARGIKVCDEWRHDYKAFGKWAVTHGWKPGRLVIDRIDPKGDYCPENCRWVSRIQSNRNRTNCNYYTLTLTGTASQWAAWAGIKPDTLRHRLAAGWDIKKAIETPVP